jgi:hypothetical protein
MVVTSNGRPSRRSGASEVVVLDGVVVVEETAVVEADAGCEAESSPQAAVKLRTTTGTASRQSMECTPSP